MLREERRIAQTKLAEDLHMGISTVAMYESDERMPKREYFEQIADYFKVDKNFLYGRTHVRNRINELPEETRVVALSIKQVPLLNAVICGKSIYAKE